MALTIVGDIHCKPDNLNKVNTLFDLVEELGNDAVLLGDVLDTKELVRSKCFNLIYSRLEASKLNWVVLVGNHDFHDISCTTHSLEPLKSLPNVTVVDQPMFLDGFGFMPYYHDPRKFYKDLATVAVANVVFVHQGINGFDYGNGYREQNGVEAKLLRGIRPLIISGHFHTYQRDARIVYLGTPFTHAFGETGDKKYIAVLDPDTERLDLIETDFPRHVTTEVNADNDPIVALNDYHYNRVILRGSKENVKEFAASFKSVNPNYKVIEMPDVAMQAKIDETVDNIVKFKKWAEDIKKLDPETIKRGLDILDMVRK